MLKNHWPELRPASLPAHRRTMAPTPLLPRSLPCLGWQKNSSHKIRHDPTKRVPFPLPHSPPGSPSPPSPGHLEPSHVGHLSNLPKVGIEGPTPPEDGDTTIASPLAARGPTPDQPTASTETAVELKFLTINVQKAGINNPSLVNIITMLNQHFPDLLLLTETPLPPHSGALLHALRNRGYRIHHTPVNAPFQPEGLPEARLPEHIVHSGGGSWLAYKKHTS